MLSFYFGMTETGRALIIQPKEYQQRVRTCNKKTYSGCIRSRLHTLLMSAKPCGEAELLSQPCNNKVKWLILGLSPFLVSARLKEKFFFIRTNEMVLVDAIFIQKMSCKVEEVDEPPHTCLH